MKTTQIPFQKTGFFSKTMHDYLEKNKNIQPFYNNFPDISGFHNQIEEKQKSYRLQTRLTLVDALKSQYISFETSEKTIENIELIKPRKILTKK